MGHVYAEVAARHGHQQLSPGVLNQNFKTAWQRFEHFRHTTDDWSALVDATFAGLIEPLPSRTFFPELYHRFCEPDAWHVFDDVRPTLDALKSRGLALGIISNWDDRLRPLLRRLKLDSYFDAVIVSCEVGAQKPAPRIFEAACQAIHSTAATSLHVGDSREMDYRGARKAGLQARWLRRGAQTRRPESILSLGELDKL